MNDQKINLKCKACGGTFAIFLHEMAEHNSKVTCPGCGQAGEYCEADVVNAPGPA